MNEFNNFIFIFLNTLKIYFIVKRCLSHRETPQMTLATVATVDMASGVSFSVPLNDANYI
jgi:hypothetical protein